MCSQSGKNQITENDYGSNKALQFTFFPSINWFLLHIKNEIIFLFDRCIVGSV